MLRCEELGRVPYQKGRTASNLKLYLERKMVELGIYLIRIFKYLFKSKNVNILKVCLYLILDALKHKNTSLPSGLIMISFLCKNPSNVNIYFSVHGYPTVVENDDDDYKQSDRQLTRLELMEIMDGTSYDGSSYEDIYKKSAPKLRLPMVDV